MDDVVRKNVIRPSSIKQGIVASYNICQEIKELDENFIFRNAMNFLGITTVSLGRVDLIDENCIVKIRKDNTIQGAIIQGDISYVGVISYLIKINLTVDDLENRISDIGYADFFSIKGTEEFCYNI